MEYDITQTKTNMHMHIYIYTILNSIVIYNYIYNYINIKTYTYISQLNMIDNICIDTKEVCMYGYIYSVRRPPARQIPSLPLHLPSTLNLNPKLSFNINPLNRKRCHVAQCGPVRK